MAGKLCVSAHIASSPARQSSFRSRSALPAPTGREPARRPSGRGAPVSERAAQGDDLPPAHATWSSWSASRHSPSELGTPHRCSLRPSSKVMATRTRRSMIMVGPTSCCRRYDRRCSGRRQQTVWTAFMENATTLQPSGHPSQRRRSRRRRTDVTSVDDRALGIAGSPAPRGRPALIRSSELITCRRTQGIRVL